MENNEATELSKFLTHLRKENNVKQETIAQLLGMKRAVYSHYETGRVIPPIDVIYILSKYYNVPFKLMALMTVKAKNNNLEVSELNDYKDAEDLINCQDFTKYFEKASDECKRIVLMILKDNYQYHSDK